LLRMYCWLKMANLVSSPCTTSTTCSCLAFDFPAVPHFNNRCLRAACSPSRASTATAPARHLQHDLRVLSQTDTQWVTPKMGLGGVFCTAFNCGLRVGTSSLPLRWGSLRILPSPWREHACTRYGGRGDVGCVPIRSP
jgi:hypothetical protein